jgi:hypothetical protein
MSFNVVTRYFRLPFRVKMENEKLFVFARNKVVKTEINTKKQSIVKGRGASSRSQKGKAINFPQMYKFQCSATAENI